MTLTPHILVARRRSVQASMHVSGLSPHSVGYTNHGSTGAEKQRLTNEVTEKAEESFSIHRTGLAPRTWTMRKGEDSIGIDAPIAGGASILALIDGCRFRAIHLSRARGMMAPFAVDDCAIFKMSR